MSRGILVIWFANTISLFIPSKRINDFIMSLLIAVSTPTVATAYKNDHFHP